MDLRLGIHIDPPLALIPPIVRQRNVSVYQTTLRDPRRLSKEGVPDPDDQEAFRNSSAGLWGIVHASLLTSLGSPDPRIRNASAGTLVNDANLAATLGMAGVCFHTGYQKGHESREQALTAVARKLEEVLGKLQPGARVLLENGCEGTELGQTVAEVGEVVRLVDSGPDHLGLVLDTCHLHVAGFDVAAADAPERLAGEIEAAGLAPYLTALHLNDAQFACGSHRDRHAVPGQGTINDGLIRLLAHPFFAPLPCILELGVEAAEKGMAYLRGG